MSSSQTPKKTPTITIAARARASSEDSSAPSLRAPSLKSPRAARFAEATAVNSPLYPSASGRAPFNPPETTNHYMAQPQPSDVGFGYVDRHESVEMPETDDNDYPNTHHNMPKTPLKSAMKTPGQAPRGFGELMSPTFHEEAHLEKHEASTEKEQAKDLKVKTRVRMAKMLLRGVNFSCSLIVLAMLATTFNIFRATRAIPSRNSLPPWAEGQQTWPQITLLVISCVSLAMSLAIFYAYYKGGHRRAEKAAVYYTAFAVAFFVFSIVMWGIGAGILQGSKNNGGNKDLWGWSCVDNTRKQLFQNDVSYDLICRLQNWSLVCCIIEVVVETITIAIYGVVFYRYYSKKQLRKSMANRDKARSDLYLAQLRSQSAPNTPGLAGPFSPRDGGYKAPASDYYDASSDLEEGTQYASPVSAGQPMQQHASAFKLQPPPVKTATPRHAQTGFSPVMTHPRDRSVTPPEMDQRSPLMSKVDQRPWQQQQQQQEHFAAAPGETVYESVPIPGAYEAPLSPGHEARAMSFPHR